MLEGVRPVYLLDGAPAPLPVGSVRVRITNPVGGMLLDTVLTFPSDGSDITLNASVQVAEGTTDVRARAEFLGADGSTLFESGAIVVRVVFVGESQGTPPPPVDIPLTYVGPGAGSTLTLDATSPVAEAFAGDSLSLVATVRDQTAQPRSDVPVVWASLDTTTARVTSALDGRVVMGPRRGPARLVATTYTGVRDTVVIGVQPLPAMLRAVGADSIADTIGAPAVARLRVLGADSLPVRGVDVRFAATGIALDTAAVRSDSTGVVAKPFVLPAQAGASSIVATPLRGSGADSLRVRVRAGRPTALRLTGAPPATHKAGDSLPTLTATVLDRLENPVLAFGDTILAVVVDSTGAPLGAQATRAATAGAASFAALRPNRVAPRAFVELRAGSLPPQRSAGFTIIAASASRLRFVTLPADTLVAGAGLGALEVEALDPFGNRAVSFADTLRLTSSGSGPLGGPRARVAAAGFARFDSLTLTRAELGIRLTVAAAGLGADSTRPLLVRPAPATRLVIATEPAPSFVAGDTALRVTVQVQDAFGNLSTDTARAIGVSLLRRSGSAPLNGDTVRTSVAGVATFAALRVEVADSAYRLRVASGALIPDTSTAFTIRHGAAARLRLMTVPPDTLVAGTRLAGLDVEALDAFGNRALGFGDTLRLSRSGTGPLDGTRARVASAGFARFDSLTLTKAESDVRLRVEAAGVTTDSTRPLLVRPAAATRLVISSEPLSSVVAGDTTLRVTVQVQDAFGNVSTDTARTIVATLLRRSGSAPLYGDTLRTSAAGVATFAGLRVEVADSAYRLRLTSGSLTPDTSAAFVIAPAAATRLDVVAQPADSAVASATLAPFVLKVLDGFGNTVRSFTDTVRATLAVNPSGTTLSGIAAVRADTGVARFDGLSIATVGTGYRVAGSATGLTPDTSAAFRIIASTAAVAVFVTEPQDSVVAGDTLVSLTIETRDAYGNRVLATDSIKLRILSDSSAATLTGTTARVDSAGRATFSGLSLSKAGDGYRLIASVGALAPDTSRVFKVRAGNALQLAVTRSPTTTKVAGDALDTIRVEARDSYGNRVLTYSDSVALSLSTNSTGAAFYGALKVPMGSGLAGFTQVSVGLAGTGYVITAKSGSLDSATTATFAVDSATASSRKDVISAGSAVCGLGTGSQTYCWGSGWTFADNLGNANGSTLGDSTQTEGHGIPRTVGGGQSFVSVTSGIQMTCGLTSAGAAYCWGLNGSSSSVFDGRLGVGSATNAMTPQPVNGGLVFKTLSAGGVISTAGFQYGGYACGVTTTHQGYCWGRSDSLAPVIGAGAVSGPTTTTTPTLVSGSLSFATIRAGPTHACGLTLKGTAYCWGDNRFGQLGTGSTTRSGTPQAVAGGYTFVDISAGPLVTCGLTQRGDAFCWGADSLGAVGDGTIGGGNRLTPTLVVGGHRFKRIAAGYEGTCGITESGAAYCWGGESYLGSGQSGSTATPRLVSGGQTFTEIAQVQGIVRCAMTSGGAAYCWGSDFSKRLGTGFDGLNPTQVQNLPSATQLGGGRNHTCALDANSGARCWGLNVDGQLGTGVVSGNQEPTTTPQAVTGSSTFLSIASGAGSYTCGIAKADTVGYCWGSNTSGTSNGMLGNGGTTTVGSPTALSGNLRWQKIAPGQFHACGIATDSLAYCWGSNADGRTGQGTTAGNLLVPTRVQDDNAKWRDIAASSRTTCAIQAGSLQSLYCWGSNASGAMGVSTTAYTSSSFPIYIDTGYASVAMGGSGACALRRSGGSVVCWGLAALTGTGQTGSTEQARTTISGITGTVVELKAAFESFCARTSAGEAFCWGANHWGHLGSGNTLQAYTPVKVTGNHNFAELHLGFGIGCGRTTAGAVWCWGRDAFGNRGLGNSQIAYTPGIVTGNLSFRSTPP